MTPTTRTSAVSELEPARRLRQLLADDGLLVVPSAHDALTARLVEQARFEALLVGGAAVAAYNFGLPDIGLVSASELVEQLRRIVAVCNIPVVADLDDGGGSPARVRRAVELAEGAGAAGVIIEDSDPSRGTTGHGRSGPRLRCLTEAVDNVVAALRGRRNPDTVVVARTEAYKSFGLDDALERSRAFIRAGADLILITHIPNAAISLAAKALDAPLLNVATDTSLGQRQALAEAGSKVVVYPVQTMTSAFLATRDALQDMRQGRAQADAPGPTESLKALFEALDESTWRRE